MAVTVTNKPQLYTPVGNPVIWKVSTDVDNFLYFKVSILDGDGNTILNTLIYPTPDFPTGGVINLSRVLDNYVRWDIYNNLMVYPAAKSILGYTLSIAEVYLSSGVVTEGTPVSTSLQYVWDGLINRLSFANYSQDTYILKTGKVINFLTGKPSTTYLNEKGAEYLYFLNNGDVTTLVVKIDAYGSGGSSTPYTYDISAFSAYKMLMLNISPDILQSILGFDISTCTYFTIKLVDGDGADLSETRTYLYKKLECYLEPVNILFANSLGGIDTYQFVNSDITVAASRTSIKRSLDTAISELNIMDEVISSYPTESFTLNTRELSDEETMWLQELLLSKQVFFKQNSDTLVPLQLADTSISLTKKRYVTGLNTKQFTFKLSDGFTSDLLMNDIHIVIPAILGANGDFYVRNA